MEKTYLDKIQIHKDNKLAALYPSTKLLDRDSIYCVYVCNWNNSCNKVWTVITVDSAVFRDSDFMCSKRCVKKMHKGAEGGDADRCNYFGCTDVPCSGWKSGHRNRIFNDL